ncbi:MAG: cytochrome ubiquinol oxidase subunit I [Gaiellaceae bacterium]
MPGSGGALTVLASTALELARWQFALTTLFHFIFVPLTLGLAPLLAIMQTLWHRTGDEKWLRLTHFFGTLFLINFAIGVATGLVMEFQFGMNWSAFSSYVGDVFGSPLAIEGLGAFFLEATFIGLWIFGWNRLSPRVHLVTIYLVWLGTWLSAYFILAANSWMQHPVGYEINSQTGRAAANDIFQILLQGFVWFAWGHAILAGLMTGGFLVLGVACWHLLRGRNVDLFRSAAKLAILVVLPVSAVQLGFGSEFGVEVTDAQPMKIAATEALWETEQPASFSLFQIGGFSADDPTPSYSVAIPGLLSFLATNSFHGQVVGINELQDQAEQQYGPGNYVPDVRLVYWSMRVMAYLATLSFLVALWGGWVLWRKRLPDSKWFQRAAVAAIAFPFLSNFAGWILTEAGRQPWVAYGLLKTEDAVSSTVSAWAVGLSLGVFASLYALLGLLDLWLMRRYARVDPPDVGLEEEEKAPLPAPGY